MPRDGKFPSDITLGERYRDTQTGLEGIATSVHFYQHACERVTLEALSDKTGELVEYAFDAPRLVAVERPEEAVRQRKPGGPARPGEVRAVPARR
jgi:hypothetical protein